LRLTKEINKMKSAFPSSEETCMLAHLEHLYEQNRHRLAQPLYVRVTDAAGQIVKYEYYPEIIDEDVNLFRTSDSSEPLSFRLPVTIHVTDANGRCVEARLADLTSLPEWLYQLYPGADAHRQGNFVRKTGPTRKRWLAGAVECKTTPPTGRGRISTCPFPIANQSPAP
jgi:hypothetical protein